MFFNYAFEVLYSVFDWGKCQSKPIKPGMNRLGPLFTQEAKANMVAIYPSQSIVLQQVHFNWDCCLRKRGSEKGHELLNSLFSWNEAHSEPYMYTKHCLNT